MPSKEPRRLRVRMGPETGTAIRFVRTPTVETSSKVAATMGAVDTWAARDTEIRSETARGGRKGAGSWNFRYHPLKS